MEKIHVQDAIKTALAGLHDQMEAANAANDVLRSEQLLKAADYLIKAKGVMWLLSEAK